MDYMALQAEIETGPLATECAGKSDAEVAAILNAPHAPGVRPRFVTGRTILAEIAAGADILDKLEAAAPNIPPLKWAMRFLIGEAGIDIGHPGTRAQITALAAAGVITEPERDALLSMGETTMSRAELAGFGSITPGDVSRALRGPR